MSELKAETIVPQGTTITLQMYPKAEADKVIAEKDAKILALDAEVAKQKHHAELFFDERNYAETQLRHSNRKRCLAMARWCERKRIDAAYYRIPREKWDFYGKWNKIWLILAEKFNYSER